jgi:hypothetical protein
MGRYDDAREAFRQLTALKPPAADPPVIMSQRPEQRAFFLSGFLSGYRRAMGEVA